ncbi:two-component regulator propeller domain-containing protein [Carboxylicivirga taeanensis]|uniref:two-component regulator propeller domain-containing protein n=1 Tax=Carboxylicivirga taeanensis TaxID=1416875 RepID=UPI003F6DFECA
MKRFFVIGFILMFMQWGAAQNSPIRFQSISINDGLSLSSVYCIYKDSKGFMWFGTEDGLNKFDGYHFTIYRTEVKNPNSICYKWIEHIAEDANGHLWFASRNGLSRFNPVSEVFKNYKASQSDLLVNDTITCLKVHDDHVFIGSKKGLSTINVSTNETALFDTLVEVNSLQLYGNQLIIGAGNGLFLLADGTDLKRLSTVGVTDVTLDSAIVYYSGRTGLFRYNLMDGSDVAIATPETMGEIDNLEWDEQGRLWVSAINGLWEYDPRKGWSKQILETANTTRSLATNTSKSLWVSDSGTVWYATHGDGLFIVNDQLELTRCLHNPTDRESVSQNAFNCIYADPQNGNVWFGTYGAGINIYQPAANKFDLIKHNPLEANSLSSNFVWSIFESADGCLWIGTNDKGLCHYCPKTDRFTTYLHRADAIGSLSNNTVREVFQDSRGVIWAGTDGGGLNRFDPLTNRFKAYLHNADDEQSISDNSVRVLFEDSSGRLWVGTRNGLNLFDRQTGTFHRYLSSETDPQSLSNNFVYASIVEDRFGRLWIGTYGGGLNRFNPETGIFDRYTTATEKGFRLSNNIVFCVYEDVGGMIWVGTNEGLNILNPANGRVKVLGVKDGLPNEVIYSILPDSNGHLWLSTNQGICSINRSTLACKNYDVNDGLQSNEFNGGAFHKGHSGKLYFGGVYGLNILTPEVLSENTLVNKPVITRLEVLGKPVYTVHGTGSNRHVVAELDSQFVMPANISYTEHIVLDYRQRFFALEYSGLNHLFSAKTKYAFQLYPNDKEWNSAGSRNYVSFANIKPGDYIFKVISTNSDGVWSKEAATLKISIRPPFWQTSWFVLLELIVVLMVIVFIYRFLLKMKTNKVLLLQNQQILEANRQLQISEENLKQMNATKDMFFSIISHDLKNPFTSLMSISQMLEQNYETTDEEDKRHAVKRINSSVQNIYQLLENLLTWSRSQRGKICFKDEDFDLSALITENINLYKAVAAKKSIRLINNVPDAFSAKGDRNSINTIIRNLTGNAVKFTAGGEIVFSISSSDEHWKVSIKDTGVGISPENLKYLFRTDKKLKAEGTDGEKGTGLGLIICKEFAEKNGGQIGALSQQGVGSEFWFTIRKGRRE